MRAFWHCAALAASQVEGHGCPAAMLAATMQRAGDVSYGEAGIPAQAFAVK